MHLAGFRQNANWMIIYVQFQMLFQFNFVAVS